VSKRRTGRVILRGLGHSALGVQRTADEASSETRELILFRGAIIAGYGTQEIIE